MRRPKRCSYRSATLALSVTAMVAAAADMCSAWRIIRRAALGHLARSLSMPSICRMLGTPAMRANGTTGALPAMKYMATSGRSFVTMCPVLTAVCTMVSRYLFLTVGRCTSRAPACSSRFSVMCGRQ